MSQPFITFPACFRACLSTENQPLCIDFRIIVHPNFCFYKVISVLSSTWLSVRNENILWLQVRLLIPSRWDWCGGPEQPGFTCRHGCCNGPGGGRGWWAPAGGTPPQHPERSGDRDSAGISCSTTDTSSPSSSPSTPSLSSLWFWVNCSSAFLLLSR